MPLMLLMPPKASRSSKGGLAAWRNPRGAKSALAGDLAVTYARLADLQAENLNANLGDPKAAARYATQALTLFPLGAPAHAQDALFVLWWARAMRAEANNQRSAGDAAGALQWRERQRDLQQMGVEVLPFAQVQASPALSGLCEATSTATQVGNVAAALINLAAGGRNNSSAADFEAVAEPAVYRASIGASLRQVREMRVSRLKAEHAVGHCSGGLRRRR